MKKKNVYLILGALTLTCLSGCHKDKPVQTEPAPLETIAPETQSETISDKLDETAPDLDIKDMQGYMVTPDGEVLSGKEADEYMMKEVWGIDVSDTSETEENSSSDTSSSSAKNEESVDNNTETKSENVTSESESLTETPTLSDEQIAEDQRDFTDDEYEQMQKEIDEWTYQEAIKRMGGQQ